MQALIKSLFILAVGALAAGCTADLRGDTLKAPVPPEAARARLDSAAVAHGRSAWKGKSALEVRFQDDWESILAAMMGLEPWDAEDQIRMRVLTNRYDGRIDFVAGPRAGEAWGLQGEEFWRLKDDGTIERAPDDGETFVLRAIAYLFELPFRLPDAEIVVDAGDATFEGRRYHRVLATWNSLEPNDSDQYRVWIDQETGRIGLVDHTVREQGGFFESRTIYGDYRDTEGVLLPYVMTITDVGNDRSDGFIHKLVVQDAGYGRFNAAALSPDAPMARP